MLRVFQIALVVAAWCVVVGVAQAEWVTPTWDILDENYGSGAGQVSFLDSYYAAFGPGDPVETLSDGKATLTLPSGSAVYYEAKQTIAGMVTGNADFTMEYKMRTPANSSVNLYLSETNSTATTSWNHIFIHNGTYISGATPDTLQDYNWRNDSNQAPLGYDGSIDHTFRFVRANGATKIYLDGSLTSIVTMLDQSAGAAPDSVNMMWGYLQDASQSVDVDMYYLKIASGAQLAVPEPSAIIIMMVTGLFGLVAYGWRKRR